MLITTLVENTAISKEYKNKHGLSIYIKTSNHNILFDLGPDKSFIENANKLNIDISSVDIVIISHGHNDHGGGLGEFLKCNDKAKIYITKNAFGLYYSSVLKYGKSYIGLDSNIKYNDRIIFTEEFFTVDNNLYLISNIQGTYLRPSANSNLFKNESGKYINDTFDHEQNLIIKDSGKNILVSGCSHCGIINILDTAESILGENIDIVIGGLHLFNPSTKKIENIDVINAIADNLSKRNCKFYTCHCTGIEPFKLLKNSIGEKIESLSTGQVLSL